MTPRELELTTALARLAGSIKGVAEAMLWPGAVEPTKLSESLHGYADEALAVLHKKESPR